MPQDLFFIALIPPEEIRMRVQEIKYYFREKFNSFHSLNAPPHITLLSPFRLAEGKEEALHLVLKDLASELTSFNVQLKDFGVFEPRVIFIDIVSSEPLLNTQKLIEKQARKHPQIFNYRYDERPFHPHLTLAFKDLTRKNFDAAWEEFRDKGFQGEFLADKLSLLRHNGEIWEVVRSFDL